MPLPKLTVLSTETAIHCGSRPDRCEKCPANKKNGGRCSGCSAAKLASCEMANCYQECNTCTGFKVEVPAICVKAPLRNTFMSLVTNGAPEWARAEYKFFPQKRIDLDCKAVVVARGGGVKSTKDSPYIPEMSAVAVTLPDVWSKKGGWFSADLKDYLRLRPHQKLILLTTMRDDVLEDAWDEEWFGGDTHTKAGIDYWMPLAFSTYFNDSHMQNYFSTLRTMYATMRGRAHFAMLANLPGLDLDDYRIQAAKILKQGVFNSQFLVTDEALTRSVINAKKWNDLLPEEIPFWFVGMATPRYVHNIRKYVPKRDIYFVSANAFRLAGHGKRLYDSGKAAKDAGASKEELLYENQRAFIRCVNLHSKQSLSPNAGAKVLESRSKKKR